MSRTGPQKIPGAVLDLYFGDGRYSGSDMEVNCGVIHTTEGATLYDYEDGRSAPTVTAVPDFASQRLVWHQHFDIDESARALVNAPGGVNTNTANVLQIELVGTCDPAAHARWTKAGIQHIYWPEPPAWAIRDLAWLMRWLRDQHGIPLTGAAEWLPYPASYGNSRVRMSFEQWRAFTGWCGHQHVPENDHGDPGNLPFARLLSVARGETPQPPTEEDPLAAFTEADLLRIFQQAATSVPVRDSNAFATLWWLRNALTGTVPPAAAGQPWAQLIPQLHDLLKQELSPEALAKLEALITKAVAGGANIAVDINVTGPNPQES